MNWTRLFNRLRGTPAGHEEGIDEELAFHRTMKEREFAAGGMTAFEARDAARRALGNATLTREDARAQWTFPLLGDLARDFRYGSRSLLAQPAFTTAAVLALVLGIGVNAILFSIYNALALTPWAVRDAGSVVRVMKTNEGGGWEGFSWPAFRYLRDHSRSAVVTAFDNVGCSVKRRDATWMAEGTTVDENYFGVLGTGFAAGRGFSPSNGNLRDPAPEVVLHYGEWIRRYGGDRGVIGEWIELNGHRLQIVGVAAEGFSGPVPVSPNFWMPAPWHDLLRPGQASMDKADNCCNKVLARLNPGVARDQSQAELDTLLAQFDRETKRDPSRVILTAPTLLADPRISAKTTPMFIAVGTASFLILLLACANVANLQLARGVSRWREFAVRTSLGASRGRILRQLLVESILLAGLAGSFTALLSSWAPTAIMNAIATATSATGQLNFKFTNDWRVVVAVAGISMASTLFFGLIPAWITSRHSVSAGLQQGGRSTATGRLRIGLLAVQVILCTVLLSGASLLVRALDEAQHADVGFASSRMVVVNPNLDSSGIEVDQTRGVTESLIERLKTLPGVESVAHAVVVPLGNRNDSVGIELPGTHEHISFAYNRVSANFFETMGVAMVAGRALTKADETRKDIVIINEALAKRAWPNQNPIGKELLGTVIGVVRDFDIREIGPSSEPAAFTPNPPSRDSQILVRFGPAANALALTGQGVTVARAMDKRLTMTSAQPYDLIIDRARQATMLIATIAGCLSMLALTLACVGIYGVAGYSVSQRTREIGVRMALGAKPRAIVQMILGENLRVVVVGGILGIVAALAFGRLLTSLLYGVKPGDPLAIFATIAILLATAGAAAWLPARRAASVDPAITLRHD